MPKHMCRMIVSWEPGWSPAPETQFWHPYSDIKEDVDEHEIAERETIELHMSLASS
jgi:hypothetical protein